MTNRNIREFLGLIAPYKAAVAGAFFVILAGNLLELAFPWAVKILLDDALARKDLRLLGLVCSGLLIVFALRFVCGFLREFLFALVGENVVGDLRNRMYWHLQRLSVEYRERTTSGGFISGLVGDVDSVKNFLFGGMIDFTFSFFSLAFVLTLLFFLNPGLTLVALCFLPLVAVSYLRHTGRLQDSHRRLREKYAELTTRVSEVFKGMRVVAGYAAEEHEAGLFAAKQREIVSSAVKSHKLAIALWMGADLLSYAGLALILWLGGRQVIEGRWSAGALVAYYSYLAMLFVPVVKMAVIGNHYQQAAASMERVRAVLDTVPSVRDTGNLEFKDVRTGIEFKGLGFAYGGGSKVLDGLDLFVPAGSTAAFVGKSGAGKTTLVSLLLRFYDGYQGTILVDGTDIRRYRLGSLRSRCAVVPQDDHLFSGTIRENIVYGRPDASEERVTAAARAANCHDFIAALPRGYDSLLGEGGVNLSFGQRQRVSLARAILRDPAILILDEATSGVDSGTERRIVEDAYLRAMAGRTTLIIAHRLAAACRADRIFVLDNGRIRESGNHRELLESKGPYWRMWNEQYVRDPGSDPVTSGS